MRIAGRLLPRLGLFAALLLATGARAAEPAPLTYTIRFADLASHIARIEMSVPAEGVGTLELMMPVWTPGYYRQEDYAAKVRSIVARTAAGPLAVERRANRWRIEGVDGDLTVTYDLVCDGRSVTANWVGNDLAVINGASAFITRVDPPGMRRPHIVRMELPPQWKESISAMQPAPGQGPNHYLAPDYDTLVDSPILAGNLVLTHFDVEGSQHIIADAGELGQWDSRAAAANIEKIVRAHHDLFGDLPFKRYVFLNVFRQGGGGLEHMNSTLLTSSSRNAVPGGTRGWLNFVSHEYFHAFNVKRFRPVELGPFDYERPPRTPSLWVSEGLTVYYGELLVARAGLSTQADFLASTSGHIRSLQNTAGRLKQTLEQASLEVFTSGGTSGVGGDTANTISYYGKGTVVGFLLDARIRRLTDGRRSLDDVMREGMKRYGTEKGFTPGEFVALVEAMIGGDGGGMKEWLHKVLATTEELDYADALEWYGLRFAPQEAPDPRTAFTLEIRSDTSADQKARLEALTAPNRPIR